MKKHNSNMYIVSKVKCGVSLIVNENMGVGHTASEEYLTFKKYTGNEMVCI